MVPSLFRRRQPSAHLRFLFMPYPFIRCTWGEHRRAHGGVDVGVESFHTLLRLLLSERSSIRGMDGM
eukprot:2794182-Alexandrium_andersonii.AAC.1